MFQKTQRKDSRNSAYEMFAYNLWSMMLTNFFLLHDQHKGCTLLMLSDPPFGPTTGVPRSSPLAKVVGLGLPDSLGVTLGPLLATSYYVFTLAFVVAAFGSVYALLIVRCPDLLVLGDLLPVFFLILPTCLDPVGQACSGFLVLSVSL
jgi:hypothetical protein